MPVDERVLTVVEALYDAAMDEARWPAALQLLTAATGSQAASFWVLHDPSRPRLPTFTYIGFDPRFIDEYLDHMVPLDPTVQYLVGHPRERIVHDGLVISERAKDRHEYYDWHGRHSDMRFRLVGSVSPAAGVQAGVALHRANRAGAYEPKEIEQFGLLYRHLDRALRIGFTLGTLGTLQRCTTELLDRNPAAIVLLDEHGLLVFANRRASALSAAADGVRLSPEGLTLGRSTDNHRLKSLIAQAISAEDAADGARLGAMSASRPSGKRPYAIQVSPVSKTDSRLSLVRAAVCVVVVDPEEEKRVPLAHLRAVFGFTDAEARLAARLAAGDTLRAAAATLGISYGTARARLHEVLQKTQTRRQAELVKLLLTTLASAR